MHEVCELYVDTWEGLLDSKGYDISWGHGVQKTFTGFKMV